ncbi:MAG TPA: carboxypeptidase-like regulatory domain-containing protein [Solirubrobacteraceae bacterium]
MSRVQSYLTGLLAAALLVLGLAGALPAGAATGDGQITGRVTDGNGVPLGDITVAAVPVGGDTIVTTKSKADGTYILELAPGSYDVGFNAQVVAKTNIDYQSVIFGGPGPGPTDTCTVCGGAPVTVTAGVDTTNVSALLPPAGFTQTGSVRPLSGNTIGTVGGRITFKIGCHEDPTGCHGTANLRLGTTTSGPIIARATVSVSNGNVANLHFTIPLSVRSRLVRAGTRGLQATVAISTAHGPKSVTHFKLRA